MRTHVFPRNFVDEQFWLIAEIYVIANERLDPAESDVCNALDQLQNDAALVV